MNRVATAQVACYVRPVSRRRPQTVRAGSRRARGRGPFATAASTAVAGAVAAILAYTATAFAFTDGYGGYNICGSNCYIQSSGAHSFVFNRGAIQDGAYIACQLFNHAGTYNHVTHGYGLCQQSAPSSPYKWARVYNQSGVTRVTSGTANT